MVYTQKKFAAWLKSSLATAVTTAESIGLRSFWKKIQGMNLLILGSTQQAELLKECPIKDRIFVPPQTEESSTERVINTPYNALPVLSDTVDLIVLPHTLEIVEEPHEVLRHVEKALRIGGHLIIIGFNPWSLWGLRQLFSFRRSAPWSNTFYCAWRISDWLRVLNFEVVKLNRTLYRPPINNMKFFRALKFMEFLGRFLFPFFGGSYVLLAEKKRYVLTPLKEQWKELAMNFQANMAPPVTRNIKHESDR
ncbi:MAG: methyltransferase domain-containing protein [Pseudomonadota bacterium]